MIAMTADAGSVQIPHGRPFTTDDLGGMPNDGNRYELLDGMLLVSPAPGLRHQTMAYRLYGVLEAACPADLQVVGASFAVRPSKRTELQPDVLVARRADLTEALLPAAPVLTVEIVSPSSVLNDLNNKKAAYQQLGVPSYWVLDPTGPSLTVFELDDAGRYRKVATADGREAFDADRPFRVRVVPAELLGH